MVRTAAILAAGEGTRLDKPNTPKPLVKVGEKPIIFTLLEQLISSGITKVFVVVGYQKERLIQEISSSFVTRLDLEFVEAPRYKEGIASSCLALADRLKEPFVLSMGDHLFDDTHVRTVVAQEPSPESAFVLVDRRERMDLNLSSAVKVTLQEERVVTISDTLPDQDGVDTGLFALHPSFFATLRASCQGGDTSLFGAFQALADRGALKAVFMVSGEWYDVDTPLDVVSAEMSYRKAFRTGFVQPTATCNDHLETFDFIAGKPLVTQMLVGRGIFAAPNSVSVVPPDSASSPIFVFTDETVGELYGKKYEQHLRKLGYRSHLLVMPDGEESKSLSNYVNLTEKVLGLGVDERSLFLSVGGGVVCTVCGFIASTIYRGLELVHLPTSLMAQCDAAISHKQAINGHMGKNMVGSYYSPRAVYVDIETLLTLEERLIHDGLAEVVKHAIGQERSYVDLLLNHRGEYVRNLDLLEEVIKRNVRLKCLLSKDDPKELSEGMVLQYGHTVGHPVEHLSGYTLYHGESVAIGMMVAARVSQLMGGCDQHLVDLHEELLTKYGLPTKVPGYINSADMLKTLKYNKRYLTEGTRMALLSDVGTLWSVNNDYAIPVPQEVLVEAFNRTKE